MERLRERSVKEAVWEGQFLEDREIDFFTDAIKDMRNMLNLVAFAKTVNPYSMISLGGGIGCELLLVNAQRKVLVEINPKLIQKVNEYSARKLIKIETLEYDITNLPLPFGNKEFDLLSANSIMEHLPNILDIIKEMKRISRAFFIGSIPIGSPPKDHLHVWQWKDRNDVVDFASTFGGKVIGSYWAHYDIIWEER